MYTCIYMYMYTIQYSTVQYTIVYCTVLYCTNDSSTEQVLYFIVIFYGHLLILNYIQRTCTCTCTCTYESQLVLQLVK